jgi:hypothetical protein
VQVFPPVKVRVSPTVHVQRSKQSCGIGFKIEFGARQMFLGPKTEHIYLGNCCILNTKKEIFLNFSYLGPYFYFPETGSAELETRPDCISG